VVSEVGGGVNKAWRSTRPHLLHPPIAPTSPFRRRSKAVIERSGPNIDRGRTGRQPGDIRPKASRSFGETNASAVVAPPAQAPGGLGLPAQVSCPTLAFRRERELAIPAFAGKALPRPSS